MTNSPAHARVNGNRVQIFGEIPILTPLGLPPVAIPAAAGSSSGPLPPGKDQATHGPDFAGVNWYGTQYSFSPTQRAIVACLWRALLDGYEWVHQDTLLENADSMCGRLQTVFKNHPAWRTMIVSSDAFPGAPLGTYKLNPPK